MTKRLIVAVDIDDVIFKTVAICQSEYEKRYGVFVPASECYSKDPVVWGVGDYPEAAKRLYEIFTATDFPPITGAQDVLRRLSRQHEIWAVTGRHEKLAVSTRTSIDRYFSGIFAGIKFTGFLDGGTITKGMVCREIGADVLIDDLPAHIESVLDEGGLQKAVIFGDYPWNQAEIVDPRAVHCVDWKAVEIKIKRIANG